MSQHHVHTALDAVHTLAEGPVWDDARQRVLWVDILAGAVFEGRLRTSHDDADADADGHHHAEGQVHGIEVVRRHLFDGTVGAAVPTRDEGLLVAGQRGLTIVDPDGGVWPGADLIAPDVASRLNDGGCDPAGRFLVGSCPLDDRAGQERLYRVGVDGLTEVVDDGFTLANGIGFSPDGSSMFHIDSVPGIVWVRPYDVATGAVGPREEAFRPDGATPDGMCVDAEGTLWIAMFGGGEVRRYTPDGEVLDTVPLAVRDPTSVAFVGPALDRLLITTSRHTLSDEEVADTPDAGRLFLVDVGVQGLPTPAWAGTSERSA